MPPPFRIEQAQSPNGPVMALVVQVEGDPPAAFGLPVLEAMVKVDGPLHGWKVDGLVAALTRSLTTTATMDQARMLARTLGKVLR